MSCAPWKPATTRTSVNCTALCGAKALSVCRVAKNTAFAVVTLLAVAWAGCHSAPPPRSQPPPKPPKLTSHAAEAGPVEKASGRGDEIIVAGKRFATGTRVVTWLEPGGYDGYVMTSAPRLGLAGPPPRRDLVALQRVVDQFVLHYDGC